MAKVLASSPAETLANASSRGGGGTCPVGFGSKPEACAGNDSLNKLNNMEAPNQQPAADQPYPLPKARVESTIPTAEGSNWVYPSEQMFFNAMRRKGWDPSVEDMAAVVQIHNAVNERAWYHVLKWERLHESECDNPRLVRFQGKPTEPTPKARVMELLGYAPPFDRHDWTVDRCGTEVTYLIDFYRGASKDGTPSFHLDVRPVINSPSTFLDRAVMPLYRALGIVKD